MLWALSPQPQQCSLSAATDGGLVWQAHLQMQATMQMQFRQQQAQMQAQLRAAQAQTQAATQAAQQAAQQAQQQVMVCPTLKVGSGCQGSCGDLVKEGQTAANRGCQA